MPDAGIDPEMLFNANGFIDPLTTATVPTAGTHRLHAAARRTESGHDVCWKLGCGPWGAAGRGFWLRTLSMAETR